MQTKLRMAVFGGTGGLGEQLIPLLSDKYEVFKIGSALVDITDFQAVQSYFVNAKIDIVLNMAGKKYDTFVSDILSFENYIEVHDMLKVNINGTINIISACLPYMIEKKFGRIICLSSVFSEQNVPKNAVYCASKAFIDRFIGVANKENLRHGVTCNTIQLGYWDGGMCYRIAQEYQDKAKHKIGLKRFGAMQELYSAINFIIDTEYCCGTNLKLDGGL